MQIILPWPSRKLSPNARVHWRVKHTESKKARQVAFWLTKEAKIRPEPGLIPMRITFFPPDNRRRDDDNAIASFKAYRDGIAEAWGLDDHLFKPSYHFADPIKGGRVSVEIL